MKRKYKQIKGPQKEEIICGKKVHGKEIRRKSNYMGRGTNYIKKVLNRKGTIRKRDYIKKSLHKRRTCIERKHTRNRNYTRR